MQSHQTTSIKSTPENQYKFDLMISSLGEGKRNTSIYFRNDMTTGLDITYDVGLRKVSKNFEVYTKLLHGYPEVDFEHQALPDNDLDQLVIAIGLDFAKGGIVNFTAADINLPDGAKALLEDRETGRYTDLTSTGITYTADIPANYHGEGRFFIHMKAGSTGIDEEHILPLKAFYNGNLEIQIEGSPGDKAIASIFDINGKLLGNYQLNGENLNIIPVNNLDKGIYILKIENSNKAYRTTIPIL